MYIKLLGMVNAASLMELSYESLKIANRMKAWKNLLFLMTLFIFWANDTHTASLFTHIYLYANTVILHHNMSPHLSVNEAQYFFYTEIKTLSARFVL